MASTTVQSELLLLSMACIYVLIFNLFASIYFGSVIIICLRMEYFFVSLLTFVSVFNLRCGELFLSASLPLTLLLLPTTFQHSMINLLKCECVHLMKSILCSHVNWLFQKRLIKSLTWFYVDKKRSQFLRREKKPIVNIV